MTFNEINQSMKYIKKINNCENVNEFECLNNEIKNYYGSKYDATLTIDSIAAIYDDKSIELERDKKSLASFIKSLIDAEPLSSQFADIIRIIEQGNESIGDGKKEENFVVLVYSAYVGKINFSDEVVDFCSGARKTKFQVTPIVNSNIVRGIIQNLRDYANSLSTSKKDCPHTKIEYNYNPTNTINFDVSISVADARSRAEEAGLSQKQLDEVNIKISEIEKILKSKDDKHRKWVKAGEILKWVAEQSIQVASFMVPLICKLTS